MKVGSRWIETAGWLHPNIPPGSHFTVIDSNDQSDLVTVRLPFNDKNFSILKTIWQSKTIVNYQINVGTIWTDNSCLKLLVNCIDKNTFTYIDLLNPIKIWAGQLMHLSYFMPVDVVSENVPKYSHHSIGAITKTIIEEI